MFCSNCGKELLDDMKFCPNCGIKIQLPKQENAIYESQKSNPFKFTLDFLICIVVPLLLFIILLWTHSSIFQILSICNIPFLIGGILALNNFKNKNFFSFFSTIVFVLVSVISIIIHFLSIIYKITLIKKMAIFESGTLFIHIAIILSLAFAYVFVFENYKNKKKLISKGNIILFALSALFRLLYSYGVL